MDSSIECKPEQDARFCQKGDKKAEKGLLFK